MEVATWVTAIAGAVLAILAVFAVSTNPVKKLREDLKASLDSVGDRIDEVAKEGRDAHTAIGENIEKAVGGLRRDLGGRIDGLQAEMGNVRQDLGGRIDGLQTEMGNVRQDLGGRIDGLQTEMGNVRQDLGGRIDGLQTEMGNVRQDLGNLQGAVEKTNS